MQVKSVLLFSGHNERAIVALCHFFTAAAIPISVVASGPQDAIYRTAWRDRVVYERRDGCLSVDLFAEILKACAEFHLLYCPTSEYLNGFVLANRRELEALGVDISLPDTSFYFTLTDKRASTQFAAEDLGLRVPPELPFSSAKVPCVFKPKRNILGGNIAYPLLCHSEEDLQRAQELANAEDWFVQSFIHGQSFYLCAYLSATGLYEHYWQENLVQQSGGKSIVLARVGQNPGIDTERLIRKFLQKGYSGPLMVEFMVESGRVYFVEINPRFWGPLMLCLSLRPELLCLYSLDQGLGSAHFEALDNEYYAWWYGAYAQSEPLRFYPAARSSGISDLDMDLFEKNDIYRTPETIALSGRH
jgi:hypothetical protein